MAEVCAILLALLVVINVAVLIYYFYRKKYPTKCPVCPGRVLALSYYYGYLEIVIPRTGDQGSKDIVERMYEFEAANDVKFPVKKLFILLPTSMYAPPSLDDCIKGKLFHCLQRNEQSLEKIILDKGGVIKREYHNSVYKIKGSKDNWYVVAECATALLTLHKFFNVEPHLKKYKSLIYNSFRSSLIEFLNENQNCRNKFEIIEYDDESSNDLVCFGDLLEQRIKSLIE